MARKSRLTPEQWAEIDRRLINGERPAPLAREFCVTEWLLAGRKRDLRNADTGQMELRRLMRAVGNAKDDETYVTAILKVWEVWRNREGVPDRLGPEDGLRIRSRPLPH